MGQAFYFKVTEWRLSVCPCKGWGAGRGRSGRDHSPSISTCQRDRRGDWGSLALRWLNPSSAVQTDAPISSLHVKKWKLKLNKELVWCRTAEKSNTQSLRHQSSCFWLVPRNGRAAATKRMVFLLSLPLSLWPETTTTGSKGQPTRWTSQLYYVAQLWLWTISLTSQNIRFPYLWNWDKR